MATDAGFRLVSPFTPAGDQGAAIDALVANFRAGTPRQTLLGITGSGKTYAMASVIAALDVPTLIISHNKTLAAQLFAEFRGFFPHNAVEYFVSYYDYYQPEAYVAASDTYIAKDADINEEIERLRLAATCALAMRRDTVIVASVSCIFGLGSPAEYLKAAVRIRAGERDSISGLARRLVAIRYERNQLDFTRGTFRIKGDTVDIFPAYGLDGVRVEFFGDTVERIALFHPVTGHTLRGLDQTLIFPAEHYVAGEESTRRALASIESELAARLQELKRDGKDLYAQRLEERVLHDLEMIRELGTCSGIENYSRHFDGRVPGAPPYTLLDYFPEGFLTIVDESHVTLSQVHAMYGGDRSRKESLVNYGFRLPSAYDNRPLTFDEWNGRARQLLFVSATPSAWEREQSGAVVEQVLRPTGLLDPEIVVRPVRGAVDDLTGEIRALAAKGERTLALTLTKKMAEDLSSYLQNLDIRATYLHADITTLERLAILRQLRAGEVDVLVGINLLREGLDLPEVSLVAILDADQQGFLRSATSLLQMAGRAARNVNGRVILYADKVTDAMRQTIETTRRRRVVQAAHNDKYGITPQTIKKNVAALDGIIPAPAAKRGGKAEKPPADLDRDRLYLEMVQAAQALEFERAAQLRDLIFALEAGEDPAAVAKELPGKQSPAEDTQP